MPYTEPDPVSCHHISMVWSLSVKSLLRSVVSGGLNQTIIEYSPNVIPEARPSVVQLSQKTEVSARFSHFRICCSLLLPT